MAKQLKKLLKSFTLIELIIVIAIIAVLGATAFLLLTQWMSKGRDAQRISDLSTIKTALDIALTKNDELPLPDENNVLLYSGTEILNQGLFGDQVVKSIGTLNKVPRDRINGEYEYSLLYDKKTYRVRTEIENEQYKMAFIEKVKANNNFYRYVGKDLKAVVVKEMFIYLPSMFISGYVGGEYDLYENDFDVFIGDNIGEYKSGFAIHMSDIDTIKAELDSLGLEENEISQIIAQGTGQPQIVTEAKCNGILPENAEMNGNQKNGIDLTYSETFGDCKYKCKSGYYYTGGNCEISNIVTGNATDGFSYFQNGVQIYPQSCNDLLVSTEPNFKINGPWDGTTFVDGVYWIKPDSSIVNAYCNFNLNNDGWTLVMNLDTNDGSVKHYNSPYRTDTINYGVVGNSLTADYKDGNLFQVGSDRLLLTVHQEGVLLAYKEYNLNELDKSLYYYFNKGSSIKLTNGSIDSFGLENLNTKEPTIKQSSDLYLNTSRGYLISDRDRLSIGIAITNNYGGGLGTYYDSDRALYQRPYGEGQLLNCFWENAPCTIGDDNSGSNPLWNAKSGLQYDYSFYIK
ncbi:MAG: prepilin-type N-terminal cleavage/methylation domain-containing protein [Candidatus Absconditabacteria bacterium]